MAKQSPIVISFNENGVTLEDPKSIDFLQKISPLIEHNQSSFKELSSLSVLLKNYSGSDILAYAICWEGKDSDGLTQRKYAISIDTNHFKSVLKSGTEEIISPIGPISTSLSIPNTLIQEEIQNQSNLKDVAVQVDAIIFDDGKTLGPNKSRLLERIKSIALAEKNVFQAILSSQLGNEALLEWIKHQGEYNHFKQHPDINDTAYQSMRYAHEWSLKFRELFSTASVSGVAALRESIKKITSSKDYPESLVN